MTVSISLLQRIFTPPKLCVNCIKVEILKLELGKQCLKLTTAVVKMKFSRSVSFGVGGIVDCNYRSRRRVVVDMRARFV
jgi:hypothetical protein